MFRKGQTYNLSDPKAESIYHSDVVGVFRRNESVAIRGKIKAGGVQKLLDDLSEHRSDNTNNNDEIKQKYKYVGKRRGSEGCVTAGLDARHSEERRNSSPNIKTDDVPRLRPKKISKESSLDKQKKRHSSYAELLEEVTNELNLEAVKVDSAADLIIQDAFNFLDKEQDNSHVNLHLIKKRFL